MFTNMFIYREEFGQSFEYDSKRNVTSVASLSTQKANMTYDDSDNLISYHQPGAEESAKYTMNYGETTAERQKHLLKKSVTPMGQRDTYTYDGRGNALTAIRQKSGETAFIKTESGYSADGNYRLSTKDARGNKVVQSIDPNTGTLTNVTDPNGQMVSYAYDTSKRVTAVQTTADGKTYRNGYTYENDRIKTVSHNTTSNTENDVTYTFEYDSLGRKTNVKVGEQTLSTNVYENDRAGLLSEVQYGNGGKVQYAYDDFDRMTGVRYDGEETDRYSYEYDANGNAVLVRDHALNRVLQTGHDLADRPMDTQLRNADGSLIYRTQLDYDAQNRLVGFGEETENAAYKTGYTYDTDNRITEMDFGGDDKIRYTYDSLGRVSARTVENGTDAGKLETAYSFAAGGYGEDSTTPLVESIRQPGVSFDYAYDNRGNIISEKRYAPGTAEADKLETTYEYDALGQLIRVNDPHENVTWVYTYDRGGNILRKARCAYTTGNLGEALEVIPYTYGDANWKDKLTAYNGKSITYDAIGNPLNDGERTYEWEAGRRLKHISIPLIGSEPAGLHISYGLHAGSQTLLKIIASNDNTVLTAQVARDDREITDMCPASSFNWTRVSGDAAADAAWNASHAGMKQIALLPVDMASDVQITCTYSETEGSYGTMQVDEALMASHTPATADASDVFVLVDGDLVVTTASENGTDYVLEDDTLTVNSGFTGTISATAAFSSGEQDADVENIFGLHFENAVHADSQTLLRIVAANENTALEAHVVRGGREITAEYPASQFNWTRVSGDAAADAAWNANHAGMKQIALTPADTVSGVEFRCTYSETEGSYGTVQVDGAMTAHHTPAATDANDTFALENGVLTVTTDSENGSDYAVDGNTLIVNSGFTGTITSTVTVTDGARTREIDFIYDHNGLRTGKVVTEGEKTETTEYTLHSKLITHMTKRCVDEYGAETVQNLHFFYDAQSRPAFVEYDGIRYRYLHNLQGDIVGIVDANGALVVEYKYDAWGKPISTTGSMADTLGRYNPFRYRGYVYDEETVLYYLPSRCYNAKTGRFIRSDLILPSKINDNCIFAYCANNPVSNVDAGGLIYYKVTLNIYNEKYIPRLGYGHYDISIMAYNDENQEIKRKTISYGPSGDEMGCEAIITIYDNDNPRVESLHERLVIYDDITEAEMEEFRSWFYGEFLGEEENPNVYRVKDENFKYYGFDETRTKPGSFDQNYCGSTALYLLHRIRKIASGTRCMLSEVFLVMKSMPVFFSRENKYPLGDLRAWFSSKK